MKKLYFLLMLSFFFLTNLYCQDSYQRAKDTRVVDPKFLLTSYEDWGLDLSIGTTLYRGNTSITSIYTNLDFIKRCKDFSFLFGANGLYYSIGTPRTRYQNNVDLNLRMDYHLNENWRIVAINTHSFHELILLDYRITLGVGPWYDIKTKRISNGISLFIIPEYEKFRGYADEDATRFSFRNLFKFALNEYANFGVDFYYAPTVNNIKDYRIYLEGFIETKITEETLYLKVLTAAEHDSLPKPTISRNDVKFMTALVFKMGK